MRLPKPDGDGVPCTSPALRRHMLISMGGTFRVVHSPFLSSTSARGVVDHTMIVIRCPTAQACRLAHCKACMLREEAVLVRACMLIVGFVGWR
jgi:hypothetical protein